jgi:hypothetical protein
MKSFFLFFIVMFFCLSSFSQETVQESGISGLKYKPEIPDSSSYQILKNLSNAPIEEKILKQINFHRRDNEDYLWVVREGLEIRIFSIQTINH